MLGSWLRRRVDCSRRANSPTEAPLTGALAPRKLAFLLQFGPAHVMRVAAAILQGQETGHAFDHRRSRR